MFWNLLKIALRNLLKHKGYSFINIAGLAIGLACCFYILFYVQFELSYDRYHKDYERIYRVGLHKQTESRDDRFAGCSDLVAPTLRENYPEVKAVARVAPSRAYAVRYGDRVFFEDNINTADPDVFEIFNIRFIEGSPLSALDRPHTAVLTEEMVTKYFGNENPIGKKLTIRSDEFEITGIIENPPANTHWHYGIISSWKTIENHEWMNHWDGSIIPTYFKLAPGFKAAEFENKISKLADRYIGEELREKKISLTYFLQSLKDIHLYSNLKSEVEPPGKPLYIFIFSGVGILILLIACFNFMNLTTARSANRAGEVGVRKVVGAHRANLFWQFIGESVLVSLIAFGGALLLVDLTLGWFNDITGSAFTMKALIEPRIFLKILLLTLLAGILAGAYPAVFLSSFKPAVVLKGALGAGSRGVLLRKILVVGQFTISIILIIATVMVFRQLNFMKNYSLGFEKEQKLVVGFDLEALDANNYESVKNEFLSNPAITGATASSSIPGRWMYRWRVWVAGEETTNNHTMNFFQADHDFFKSYKLEMAAGHYFQEGLTNGYIINEAAVRKFGWASAEEAVGKKLFRERGVITGVVRNFHFRGLQETVEPLIMYLIEDDFKFLTLTVNTTNLDNTVNFVKNKYRELFPDKPYEVFFLDSDFEKQYQTEVRLGKIFGLFTLLGLVIAGLGLFGLVSFVAQQRTKEIGIRKIMGASVNSIVTLLSKEFFQLLLLANIIAWPLAYLAVRRWLQNFAYRVEIEIEIFIFSAFLALVIAFISVSFRALRAALANPVESLKHE